MKNVLLVEGGLGKQIAMTGLFSEFAKSQGDGVIVISPHDYIFWNIPGIETYNTNHKRLYEVIIKPNRFINVEPYFCYRTYSAGESIINSAAEILGMPVGAEYTPKVRFSTFELNEAEAFRNRKENAGGYILFQPFGASHGPHGDHTSRSMPIDFATKLASELTKKYKVYQVSSLGIPPLPECTVFNESVTPRQIMAISQHATHIITVDSFMNHVSPAVGKQAVVVWGSTSEKIFGYEGNVNIREFQCPDFIPTRLMVNDPEIDEKNSYSNKFTDKTLHAILQHID